jgi:hypothetical protein
MCAHILKFLKSTPYRVSRNKSYEKYPESHLGCIAIKLCGNLFVYYYEEVEQLCKKGNSIE